MNIFSTIGYLKKALKLKGFEGLSFKIRQPVAKQSIGEKNG